MAKSLGSSPSRFLFMWGNNQMVTSHKTVDQMIKIILRHVPKKVAQRMVRDLYHEVQGSKSVMATFALLAQELHTDEGNNGTED
jgi:hypothetical protein